MQNKNNTESSAQVNKGDTQQIEASNADLADVTISDTDTSPASGSVGSQTNTIMHSDDNIASPPTEPSVADIANSLEHNLVAKEGDDSEKKAPAMSMPFESQSSTSQNTTESEALQDNKASNDTLKKVGKYRSVDGNISDDRSKNASASKSDAELGISDLEENLTIQGSAVSSHKTQKNVRLLSVVVTIFIFLILLGMGIAGYYYFFVSEDDASISGDETFTQDNMLNENTDLAGIAIDGQEEVQGNESGEDSMTSTVTLGTMVLTREEYPQSNQIGTRSTFVAQQDENVFFIIYDHAEAADALTERNTFADAMRAKYPNGEVHTESAGQEYIVSYIVQNDVENYSEYNVRKFVQKADEKVSSYHFSIRKQPSTEKVTEEQKMIWFNAVQNYSNEQS